MPPLTAGEIADLLLPFSGEPLATQELERFSTYLVLLLKWNAKFNLTAVREPAQIVTRHFGEGIFAARFVPGAAKTLMDLGSGAGIPGIPIQIMRPHLDVTLVEAQQKKASFLREVIRELGLAASVRAERAERISETYDVVTLRAVEKMTDATPLAAARIGSSGTLLLLGGHETRPSDGDAASRWREVPLPKPANGWLQIGTRS